MASEDTVQCSEHGESTATYVCEHLAADPAQEWFCEYPSEDNPWPDAWCRSCEAEFQKEGEWNDRNEEALRIKLLCSHCYEKGIAASVDAVEREAEESWLELATECHHELCAKQELLDTRFSLSAHKRWDYDQETGLLTFSNDGVPAVIADIEMIGSLSSVTDTWLWSWANFHFLPNVRSHVIAVRDFGESRRFPRLTVPKLQARHAMGWELSAIAAHVLEAKGVYRVPTERGFLFMALTDLRYAT